MSIYVAVYLCIFLSIYLSISLSIYLSVYLSVYLSICLSTCLAASLKTKQSCETSSIFALDNTKNAAILRDFLNFQSWQHQKRSNSARLPAMETGVQSWRPRTNTFCCIFSLHLSKVVRLPRKSEARSYEVLHLSRKIILANLTIWCTKCNPSQESVAGPPNISGEHVSSCLLYCACHAKFI